MSERAKLPTAHKQALRTIAHETEATDMPVKAAEGDMVKLDDQPEDKSRKQPRKARRGGVTDDELQGLKQQSEMAVFRQQMAPKILDYITAEIRTRGVITFKLACYLASMEFDLSPATIERYLGPQCTDHPKARFIRTKEGIDVRKH